MGSEDVATRSADLRATRLEPRIAPGVYGALAKPQGITVGAFLWLVSFVAAMTVVAFFGTGFLLLTPPWEEMKPLQATPIPAVQITTARATPIPPKEVASASEVTLFPPVQTAAAPEATLSYSASPAAVVLVLPPLRPAIKIARRATRHVPRATDRGITFEQYRDARMQALPLQQAQLK